MATFDKPPSQRAAACRVEFVASRVGRGEPLAGNGGQRMVCRMSATKELSKAEIEAALKEIGGGWTF
ncbi:MAG TPA: hypothetical protein VG710_15795, partial [Opitutus sp.]|nr:hypothetical protein [Opitutus sp.]